MLNHWYLAISSKDQTSKERKQPMQQNHKKQKDCVHVLKQLALIPISMELYHWQTQSKSRNYI